MEQTENQTEQPVDPKDQGPTRRAPRTRKGKRRNRTRRWYQEKPIGSEGVERLTLMKFFISTENSTPEIYWLPMNREFVFEGEGTDAKCTGLRTVYAGDIERNGIPLSLTDLEEVNHVLAKAKSELIRMQAEYRKERSDAPPQIEGNVRDRRSQHEHRPLTHRIAVPNRVAVAHTPPEHVAEEPGSSALADMLQGW